MATQTKAQTGKFVWHTLNTTDPAAARKFYTSLFGWRAEEKDMGAHGKYTLFYAGEYDVAGMGALDPKSGAPSHWLAYVTVDNPDGAADKARSLGAQVLVPGMDIPGVGRFSVFADPQGAVISAFKGAPGAPERGDGDPPIGAFCWTELVSKDAKA